MVEGNGLALLPLARESDRQIIQDLYGLRLYFEGSPECGFRSRIIAALKSLRALYEIRL